MKAPKFRLKCESKKEGVIIREILNQEFFDHNLLKKIEFYQNYLDNCDASETALIAFLDYIIRLMKKKWKLRQSIKSLIVIHLGERLIIPRMVEGEEWMLVTGYVQPKKRSIAYVEEKAFAEGYLMDKTEVDIAELNKKLAYCLDKFDGKYPFDSLMLEMGWEYASKENRTN